MALQNRIQLDVFKENAGVSSVKLNSARKNVFGTANKANALVDVKNTVYMKTNATESSAKKLTNGNALEYFKKENASLIKQMKKEEVIIQDSVSADLDENLCNELDVDCPHCFNEDPDELLLATEWLGGSCLPKDVMNELCLDPNPRADSLLSPQFDILVWNNKNLMSPPRMKSSDCLFSPVYLPPLKDIQPIYEDMF